MNDGMDTNAVVITMIILSSTVLRRSAANAPRTMPAIAALNAAIRPSFAEVFMPSRIMSMT